MLIIEVDRELIIEFDRDVPHIQPLQPVHRGPSEAIFAFSMELAFQDRAPGDSFPLSVTGNLF
jgi:hypothetical protein